MEYLLLEYYIKLIDISQNTVNLNQIYSLPVYLRSKLTCILYINLKYSTFCKIYNLKLFQYNL